MDTCGMWDIKGFGNVVCSCNFVICTIKYTHTCALGTGFKLVLINAATLAPRVSNWPPKFNGILFPTLGPIQGHKVQHLLVTLGRLKRFFLVQA
jgi:hypothetical protein